MDGQAMTPTPHTTETLAEQLNPAGTHSLAYCADAAAMLRALAQENALLHERHAGDNKLYAEQAQEIERLTVERDTNKRMRDLHFAENAKLRSVLQGLLDFGTSNNADVVRKRFDAARAYLAAPEQSEPVAWICGDNDSYSRDPKRVEKWRIHGREVIPLYTTPQPKAPEPVNQMLLTALNVCADALCNSQNFILSISSDGFGAVCAEANGIAIDMANEILNAAEQAPQPTELTPKDIEALYMEHCPDDSLEAAIAFARAVLAAQKGKVK